MNKYKFIICIALFQSLSLIIAFSQEQVNYFEIGIENVKNKNWQFAEINLNKYKELNPHDADVYDLLGTVYANIGDYSRAIEEYRKAIDLDVNHPTAHNNLGIVYKILGYMDKSVSEFKQSIIINLNFLIEVDKQEKESKKNEKEIDAEELNFKRNNFYYNLYVAYSNLGDKEKAKEFFLKFKAHGKNIIGLNESFDLLEEKSKEIQSNEKGRKEEILEAEKFIEKLILNGEYDKAKEEILDLFKKGELNNANLHTNLGIVYQKKGLTREAIAEHREAIRLAPLHPTAHNNLAHSLEANEEFEEAILEYKRAINIDSQLVIAYQNLGNLFLKLGRYKEGKEIIEKAINIAPLNSLSYNLLSYLFYKEGNLKKSFEVIEDAKKKFPEDNMIKKNHEYIKQKLNEEKMKEKKALKIKPFLENGKKGKIPNINFPDSKLPPGKGITSFKDSPIIKFYQLLKVNQEILPAKFVLNTNSGWIWLIDIKEKTILPITEGFSPILFGGNLLYLDWVDFYPQVFEYQISNFKRNQITFTKKFKKNLEISPKGEKIGYIEGKGITDSDIWIYDVKSKKLTQLTKDLWVSSFKWLDNNNNILFSSEKCGLDSDYDKSCIGIMNLLDGKIQWIKSNYEDKDSKEKVNLNNFYNFTFSTFSDFNKVIISTKDGNTYIPIIDLQKNVIEKIYPFEKVGSIVLTPFWGTDENMIFFIYGRDFYVVVTNNESKITEKVFSFKDNILFIDKVK